MTTFKMGHRPLRLEDERLLRGQGCYVGDKSPHGLAHGVVVRSPSAHARIQSMDVSSIRTLTGVLDVIAASDLAAKNIGPLWPTTTENPHNNEPYRFDPQPILASEKVRYVGEPVAFVVAETYADALAAAEAFDIDYETLPPIVTPQDALAPDAPELTAAVPNNLCLDWNFGDEKGVSSAFEAAAHVCKLDIVNHRIVTHAMETRGALGFYDPNIERYQLNVASQNVHGIRDQIARSLNVEPLQVRLLAEDVGGGFGVRNFPYAEYVLTLFAASRLNRPVKWINTRSEGFVSDHQARDFRATARLALDETGRFTALQVRSIADVGGYMVGAACGVQTGQYAALPGGVYQIPSFHLHIRAALTNKAPIGVTRGPGFAEAIDVIERLIDKAARETKHNRYDLRRRNLVPPDAMPWRNAAGTVIDSGNFPRCFEATIANIEAASFAARRAQTETNGQLRGLGIACHIKGTGGLPEENIEFRFNDDSVTLSTGTQAIGQGHETSFRQIVGSLLGLPPDRIQYRAGDTDVIVMGGGHGSSRATYMAGTVMARAADKIITRGKEFAARLLAVPPNEVEWVDGFFRAPASNRTVDLLEVARHARAEGDTLDTYEWFKRDAMTYPSGCHGAEVVIDPDTGQIELVRYVAVDDYGELVNPMLVEGQMHGAIAQGVGQALLEASTYDAKTGQLITGSLMDYALPRADHFPAFDVEMMGTRCTTNPLGVKGCGEAGAIAGFPAIANAVIDALAPLGVTTFTGPATPFTIWKAIRRATLER